ncbi:probable f-box only protein 6 [Coccomyxa sp. Obi]|nr:probable f-box only protein 6 [Coccomyxa sp. Obi]
MSLIESLPNATLMSVFDLLPPLQVITTCPLVSKRFLDVALSPDLWRNKVQGLPQVLVDRLESRLSLSYAKVWYGLYQTNLLSNSNWGNIQDHRNWLMPAATGWRVTLHGGHGWQPEFPPVGSDPLDIDMLPRPGAPRVRYAGALASSYQWCEVMQPVDLLLELQKRGMQREEAEQYLDGGPELTFAVWVGARRDCPSVAQVLVVLDDGTDVLPTYTGRREFPWMRSAITHWDSGVVPTERGGWKCSWHTFTAYSKGVRRAILVLRGKDEQFWAGHYGSKFSAPELHFGKCRF